MGGDFQDQNAHEKFKNLDKLIYYVNLQASLYYIFLINFIPNYIFGRRMIAVLTSFTQHHHVIYML